MSISKLDPCETHSCLLTGISHTYKYFYTVFIIYYFFTNEQIASHLTLLGRLIYRTIFLATQRVKHPKTEPNAVNLRIFNILRVNTK